MNLDYLTASRSMNSRREKGPTESSVILIGVSVQFHVSSGPSLDFDGIPFLKVKDDWVPGVGVGSRRVSIGSHHVLIVVEKFKPGLLLNITVI